MEEEAGGQGKAAAGPKLDICERQSPLSEADLDVLLTHDVLTLSLS